METRFNVYDTITGKLVLEDVTYNHATGALYRSQPFGNAEHNVFDIQKALNGGYCRLPQRTAIQCRPILTVDELSRYQRLDSHVVVGPLGTPLTKPLARITAEHCASEWNAKVGAGFYSVQPA